MRFSRPVVSHFGSTTLGFLRAVPKTSLLEEECAEVFYRLKNDGAIRELNIKTRRPLNDIASIEQYAAERVDYVIATSHIVKNDLIGAGIDSEKIEVIHNAIEDYWFENTIKPIPAGNPSLVFLGRIGEDPFTLKLKGVDRVIGLFEHFSTVPKLSVVMSRNKPLLSWLRHKIPNHTVVANAVKDTIPALLQQYSGGIALLTSRYEGFSLSLIEAMSQGLVPISYPVGVAPEIVRNGENGFIVESLDEAKLKISLLLSDADLRRRLSQNASQTAGEMFHSDVLIGKTLELYNKILKQS